MTDPLLSPSWYRVAALKPRLRSHARWHRHRYRGQLWYVLLDPSSRRTHRLSPLAYRLAGLMNGERTTQQIWEAVTTELGDDGPTQDETIRVLALLHTADVLRCDVTPDTAELFRRALTRERQEWWRRVGNPLSVRVPLFDPDAFLARWLPLARPLFSRAMLAVYVLVLGGALLQAAAHWDELSEGAARQLLEPRNLLLLWLAFPLVKGLHELGHAFAVKLWGGEVHEIGILFLVLVPVPYVNASEAAAFPDKWKRVVVGAAGIGVECVLAALALFVWLGVEPGSMRSFAYNVMWIGGISTLLFNGNPLLRFDGYYVLADLIEIPNLGNRSTQYLSYLVQRSLLGIENAPNPVHEPGERRWFVGYGIASFVYRLFVSFAIAVFISGKFFIVGVLLALFAVTMQVVAPLLRCASFLFTSPRLEARRGRAVGASAVLASVFAGLLFWVPIPLFTLAEGVVWPPEGSQVRAAADGFVLRVVAEPGARVRAGDSLVETRDAGLETRVAVLAAQVRELDAQHHSERGHDRVRSQNTAERVAALRSELAVTRGRMRDVVIRSPAKGSFVPLRSADLPGRYVSQGDLLGYVVDGSLTAARVVVSQADAALVRERTESVELRRISRPDRVIPAVIRREVPAASNQLPSAALGTLGGGPWAVDPADPSGLSTLETVFQLDLELSGLAAIHEIGERIHVRFHHGSEPVAARLYRSLRQIFLRQTGV